MCKSMCVCARAQSDNNNNNKNTGSGYHRAPLEGSFIQMIYLRLQCGVSFLHWTIILFSITGIDFLSF